MSSIGSVLHDTPPFKVLLPPLPDSECASFVAVSQITLKHKKKSACLSSEHSDSGEILWAFLFHPDNISLLCQEGWIHDPSVPSFFQGLQASVTPFDMSLWHILKEKSIIYLGFGLVYVCVVCLFAHLCIGYRLTLGVFHNHSPMYILRWSFSLSSLLTNLARLLASEFQRSLCLPLPSTMWWCLSLLDKRWGPNLRSLCSTTDITDRTISPALHFKGPCPKAVYYLKRVKVSKKKKVAPGIFLLPTSGLE